jgi:hypothetical protein
MRYASVGTGAGASISINIGAVLTRGYKILL